MDVKYQLLTHQQAWAREVGQLLLGEKYAAIEIYCYGSSHIYLEIYLPCGRFMRTYTLTVRKGGFRLICGYFANVLHFGTLIELFDFILCDRNSY